MSSAVRKIGTHEWENPTTNHLTENLGFDSVSLLVIGDKLYIRHTGIREGIIPIDTRDMTIKSNEAVKPNK